MILSPGFFATYAVIQAVVLLALVRALDPFERPPAWLVFALAVWGGTGAALIALAGNVAVQASLEGDAREVFGNAVSAPVVEEAAKGLALVAVVIATRALPQGLGGWRMEGVTAGLVCGAAIGIGFSFTEDFFYFVKHASTESLQAGFDLFAGRRDFFGPTALHHPLFTAALGAGVGAATWSKTWRGRILWPLGGLAVAVLMHAVNNGLTALLLVLEHDLASAAAWVADERVPRAVQSTADSAGDVLFVLDYLYIGLFFAAVFLWQRHQRREVAAALQEDVGQGLVSADDVKTVCRFGGRIVTYARLARAGRRDQLRRVRVYHDEVGRLGMARWRAARDPSAAGAIPEFRRRVLAVQGVVREPGRVRAPELGIVGRERELNELEGLLVGDGAREVTVTGPGGTGKTRVAVELASRLGDRFAHGAVFVDLSSLGGAGEVGPAIAAGLDLEVPAGADPAEWLGRLLRDRELLLVLDNFEHVTPAAALVTALIGAVPRLRVLVTSRVVLGLAGETEYPLSPLPAGASADGAPSAAASLFLDRARRAGAVLDGEVDAEAVEEICRRLDGLPLAIELVAARARSLSLAGIRDRVGSALDLASTGGAGVPDRQRTLRGTVRWSEELLSDRARGTFYTLARFPAGCRLGALEGSWAGGGLLDDLQLLAESSLLRAESDPDDERRYVMLATIREYALERGGPGSGEELAGYSRALIVDLVPAGAWPKPIVRTFQIERPNLARALDDLESAGQAADALGLMTATAPLWELGGIGQARDRVGRLLASAAAIDPALGARGQRLAGRLSLLQGDYGEATRALSEALESGEEDPDLRFSCLLDLGWILMFTGRLDEAKARFESALAEARDGLGPEHASRAMAGLGRSLAELGDTARGLELARDSLRLRQEVGDERGAISAKSTIARIHLLAGDTGEALAEGEQALADARSLADRLREAEALFPLAAASYLEGDFAASAELAGARLRACGELGDTLGVAEVLDLCALLVEERGNHRSAERLARAASELRGAVGAERWPWDRERLQAGLGAIPEPEKGRPSIGLEDALSLAGETLTSL